MSANICEIIVAGISDKNCIQRSKDTRDWCDVCRNRSLGPRPNGPVMWGDDH